MTEIPVLIPPVTPQLSVPYLTPAGFQAYPTWLDLDNLIPGGAAALQDDELADVLLAASAWAVSACEEMPLHGHLVQGEQLRTRTSGSGRVYLKPRHIPLRAIISLEYGFDPAALAALPLPDPSIWSDPNGRAVSFRPGGGLLSFSGPSIQFGGGSLRTGAQTFVNWSYVAGHPNSILGAVLESGADSVTLADATSVLPGDVLRIYDPGMSEALTVAAGYVPQVPTAPPTATSVPLAAPARFAHDEGVGITGLPRAVIQAVICYAVSLLLREDVSADEPQSAFGPAARTTDGGRGGVAGGLVNDAEILIAPYRPTFRS